MQSQVLKDSKINFHLTTELFKELETDVLARTGKCAMPTGIPQLDNLIWGVHKKELLVIAARPSHGKSSLALNIAWNLARVGKRCAFLSLEMGRHSVVERLTCMEYGIHGWHLRQGVPSEVQKFKSISEQMELKLHGTPLVIFDDLGKTIFEVENLLEQFHNNIEVLFIDHAQKIISKGFGNKYEALSHYVNTLQTLAIKYNVAVVLCSQINRQGSQQQNAMDFMKGSGDIEEAADTVIAGKWLIRENKDANKEDYEINILKQRHGPCAAVTLSFNAGTFKFSDKVIPAETVDVINRWHKQRGIA